MKTIFTKEPASKKIFVTREFAASLELTWKAWTDKNMLDQWWAPKPWKANTKSMDFREGGVWLYYMQGPDGSRHYCRADYKMIVPKKMYVGDDSFCDEHGNKMVAPPGMHWKVEFQKIPAGTKVSVEITFATEKDLQTIVEMGFEQGFSMAHNNLDELFAMTKQKV
ncbi:MAG TPA: SRPBCC domain-containing protein [Chitinophagaceae bacterium]|nr:SRPBCC domain-containing protein [Chitinophagaceae bacterium]